MTSLTTLHDNVLIERTLAGQSEYFTVLMNRHLAAVRKRVKSMAPNTADEDDLVQETFVKAWRHLSAFRAEASFRTWITRVATNEVLQHHRRGRSNLIDRAVFSLDTCASREESPHEALSRREARRSVRKAIATLPEKYRKVLVLCDLDGLTAREAARSLQSGIPLVKTRLFRARQMLSTALVERKAA